MCSLAYIYNKGNVKGERSVGNIVGRGYYCNVNSGASNGANVFGEQLTSATSKDIVDLSKTNNESLLGMLGGKFIATLDESIQKYPQLFWEK